MRTVTDQQMNRVKQIQ